MDSIKIFLSSLLVLGALDFLWLGIIAKNFITRELAPIARMQGSELDAQRLPLVLAYLVMALGMTLFVAPKFSSSWLPSFAWGAAFGFVIYALFDLTNLTILKNYSVLFAVVDVAWGTLLFALTALILSRFFVAN